MKSKVQTETSYGVIPYWKRKDGIYVLIIQHKKGHWGFPKGHPNEHETPLKTATRELYEECHLKLKKILPDIILEEKYIFSQEDKIIHKRVQYFIATVEDPQALQIDTKELQDGRWVKMDEMENELTYKESKELAKKFIREISIEL